MPMKQCPRCGSGVREGAAECMICGAPMNGGQPAGESHAEARQAKAYSPMEQTTDHPAEAHGEYSETAHSSRFAPPHPEEHASHHHTEHAAGAYSPMEDAPAAPNAPNAPGAMAPAQSPALPTSPADMPSWLQPNPPAGAAPAAAAPQVTAPPPVVAPPPIAGPPLSGPLSGPPSPLAGPPAGLGGMAGGEMRVSLTGEPIAMPPPTAPAAGAAGYPTPTAPPGRAPMPPSAPARGAVRPTAARRETPAKSGGGAGALIGVVVILLLAGAGAGGWWFYQKQHGPVTAADKIISSQKGKDWPTLYSLLILPPEQSQMTEQQFADRMNQTASVADIRDYKIGEATVNGDSATVKVSLTVAFAGPLAALGTKSSDVDLPMQRVNGQWKLDMAAYQQAIMAAMMRAGGLGAFVRPDGAPGGASAAGGGSRGRRGGRGR